MTLPHAEVIGDPIVHSKSPVIHGFWLDALRIEAAYRKVHIAPDELADYFAARRRDSGWRGCNVTIPHKIETIALIDRLDASAVAVGAVNTVVAEDGGLVGYNTDVDGILAALPDHRLGAQSAVCLIGTGGAARAALAACRQRGVTRIASIARDAAGSARLFAEFGYPAVQRGLEDRDALGGADVVINATPLGMTGKGAMPASILQGLSRVKRGGVAFDMVYAPLETELLAAARAAGLAAIDGLHMLIGQAATAFEKFYGQAPPRDRDADLRVLLTA